MRLISRVDYQSTGCRCRDLKPAWWCGQRCRLGKILCFGEGAASEGLGRIVGSPRREAGGVGGMRLGDGADALHPSAHHHRRSFPFQVTQLRAAVACSAVLDAKLLLVEALGGSWLAGAKLSQHTDQFRACCVHTRASGIGVCDNKNQFFLGSRRPAAYPAAVAVG